MNFQIMQHAGGRNFVPAVDAKGHPLVFDDAKQAADAAAQLSLLKGIKFQPRPVKSKNDWRDRERNRFKAGDYKHVLWINEPWWKEIPDHFAHVGIKDKTRIAFTPDADKGQADKQTAMLPGKYLQKFFADVLTPNQIRDYAMQHNNEFEKTELKYARTVEEIEHIYKVGPTGSCFAKTTKANLYGSGDFAVAYLEDEKGKVTARTLCVPERKVYVRPYGDYYRLQDAMNKAGYRCSTSSHDYAGLRLLKKWMWVGYYTDWYPGDWDDDPDNKEFLIVT